MSFIVDTQTIQDLNILGKYKRDSIFSIYNQTDTLGGEQLLEEFFQQPLTSLSEIQKRSSLIDFFRKQALYFSIDLDILDTAQAFLNGYSGHSYLACTGRAFRRTILSRLGLKEDKTYVEAGIKASLQLISNLREYVLALHTKDQALQLKDSNLAYAWLLETNLIAQLQAEVARSKGNLSVGTMAKCDYLLRHKWAKEIQECLEIIYRIDLYQSIAKIANERDFVMAEALPKDEQYVELEHVYHPAVPNAIGNDLRFDKNENMIFLTGANMAGKSTYMKSFGIAIYLAHMGFPVPAKRMRFSVKDGLYSSINVSDNIDLGHSHYYAEVLRVKKVAEYVHEGKNMVVIFDELFKGTNVKDAFDATLSVTRAFRQHKNCQYLISTHIVEVGETLKEETNEIQYIYMPTYMKGLVPVYTYISEKGISSDKHGMVLIQKENVLELLEKSRTKF